MAASQKVYVVSTKYFMCINQGYYVIYLQNMKFELFILWTGGQEERTQMPLMPQSEKFLKTFITFFST